MDFVFSVVTAVYNAEETLRETIESVVRQTLGFENNIQYILVNDGSSDSSADICLEYKERYPNNFVYVDQKNSGVSTTRNNGMELAEGKYVLFLDSDDKWDLKAFKRMKDFFDAHYDEIDLCSCRIKLFGTAGDGEHPLDYRFDKGTRVVDLLKEPEIVSSTVGNVVYKNEALKGRRFDVTLAAGEDAVFSNTILLEKKKVGIIPNAVFYYRKDKKDELSLSKSAPNKTSWYTEVPEKYYLTLIEESKKQGKVFDFIQHVIMYDIQWRRYNSRMVPRLTEEEKNLHRDILHRVLLNVDDDNIFLIRERHYYFCLYLYELKYLEKIKDVVELRDDGYYVGENWVGELTNRRVFDILIPSVEDDCFRIQGQIRLQKIPGYTYEFYAKNEKDEIFPIETMPYEKHSVRGYVGEVIAEGLQFDTKIPVNIGDVLNIYLKVNNVEIQLHPDFTGETDLHGRWWNNYAVIDKYIVKRRKNNIEFHRDTWSKRFGSECLFWLEMTARKNIKAPIWWAERVNKQMLQGIAKRTVPKNRVAFITSRSDTLQENMKLVYDAVNAPKVTFGRYNLYRKPIDRIKGAKIVYGSKVVVTDDYLFYFRRFGKGAPKKVVQLWHASGAFKKFGKDGTIMLPAQDSLYHRYYDLVTVSSEGIRQTYADAFGIDVSKVQATGIARTDNIVNGTHREEIRASIFKTYPDLIDKEIILYVPTFRDNFGASRNKFVPELNFGRLSKNLKSHQVFVICPHPVMTEPILEESYSNVVEMREFNTDAMLNVADLMITDYSSVIFDFALMNKPVAFFCYDYDSYDRDFYLDYEKELPGEILRTEDELLDYLAKDEYTVDDRMIAFVEKYMKACDGHSTERIADAIEGFLKE